MAKTKQRIEEEKMQVQVVERTQQITLQEQEITRKEMELEAKVKKPAEAERYKLEKLAEAERLAKLSKGISLRRDKATLFTQPEPLYCYDSVHRSCFLSLFHLTGCS